MQAANLKKVFRGAPAKKLQVGVGLARREELLLTKSVPWGSGYFFRFLQATFLQICSLQIWENTVVCGARDSPRVGWRRVGSRIGLGQGQGGLWFHGVGPRGPLPWGVVGRVMYQNC